MSRDILKEGGILVPGGGGQTSYNARNNYVLQNHPD
jgi:hypothetical protein